jgi:hypothetical protein
MSTFINIPENLPQSNSQNASYEPLPKGKYDTTIYDIQQETVRSGDNVGKPRWKVQLKVVSGDYENRRLFTLIPLYVAGDFWKAQSFFEALGFSLKGNFEVPDTKDLLGKSLTARVAIREAQGDYPADNNVVGFELGKDLPVEDLLKSTLGATTVDGSVW